MHHHSSQRLAHAAGAVALSILCVSMAPAEEPARVTITVHEEGVEEPVPARIHLKNLPGIAQKAPGLPFFKDHFVFPGTVEVALVEGTYTYEVERGPERTQASGTIKVAAGEKRSLDIRLKRVALLAEEGWWSGDLHIHRPPEDVPLLAAAEDLQVAPVITWWNKQSLWKERPLPKDSILVHGGGRVSDLLAGEDERGGGALLFFGLKEPIDITTAEREFPSSMAYLRQVKAIPGAWVDIEKPFWWDAPVWVASGLVDSIGIANNHMLRVGMLENEAWGMPRPTVGFPAPRGNGFWSQELYYWILSTGHRIPPSAGSASGVLPNPVGYNRVYVHLDGPFTNEDWWKGLRAGRSFVTNGPLLRVTANGNLPGHVFRVGKGEAVTIDLEGALASRDPVASVQIVQDGKVNDVEGPTRWEGRRALGTVRLDRSGWVLVRAIVDDKTTFRFASTAPWYVEVEGTVSSGLEINAKLFRLFVRDRLHDIEKVEMAPEKRAQVVEELYRAMSYWRDLEEKGAAAR